MLAVLSRLESLPPPRGERPNTILDVLWRLDAWSRPGLSIAELISALTMCETCGLVMTKRSFHRHECLGSDEDEDEEQVAEDIDSDTIMADASNELY